MALPVQLEAGGPLAEQLATLRRQVAEQQKLLEHLMSTAEENVQLKAEVEALNEDKEALLEKNIVLEADQELLEKETARLQSSNAQLLTELNAEAAKSQALDDAFWNADFDNMEMRRECAKTSSAVEEAVAKKSAAMEEAYAAVRQACAAELEEGQEERRVLELRIRNLANLFYDASRKRVGKQLLRDDFCVFLHEELDARREKEERLESQRQAEYFERKSVAQAVSLLQNKHDIAELRASRAKLEDDNAQLHATCARLQTTMRMTSAGRRRVLARPALAVIYEEEAADAAAAAAAAPPAAAPAAKKAAAGSGAPLGSSPAAAAGVLAAKLAGCFQAAAQPALVREDSLLAELLPEEPPASRVGCWLSSIADVSDWAEG